MKVIFGEGVQHAHKHTHTNTYTQTLSKKIGTFDGLKSLI